MKSRRTTKGIAFANKRRIDVALIVLIFLLSVPAVSSLLAPGFFQTFDGDFHLAHLYWFDQALRQGHFPVRWIDEINRGRGYPFFNFYYPFLYYLAEIPYFFGVGLVNSLKLILILSFPFSGLAMYLFTKELWGKLAGFVSSILWIYLPYRFVSVYVAARLGETIAFVWPPLFLWALISFFRTRHRVFVGLGAGALSLLLLSHNIQSLIFVPFLAVAALFLSWRFHKNVEWRSVCAVIGLALLAASYFWAPVLVEKQWTLQGQKPAYDYRSSFPRAWAYLYQPWGYGLDTTGNRGGVSLQLGISQWLALAGLAVGSLYVWRQKQKRLLSEGVFLLATALFVFFLMNKISLRVWPFIPLLSQIQIPSRLVGLLGFIAALAGGWLVGVSRQWKFAPLLLVVTFPLIALYVNRNHLRPGYFERYGDDYYRTNQELLFSTTDPYGENIPVWSKLSLDTFSEKVIVDPHSPSQATLTNLNLEPRRYEFTSEAPGETWLTVRTIYYPGWRVRIDGKRAPFAFDQAYRLDSLGQLALTVPEGKHTISIRFGETPLRRSLNLISLVSWLAIGWLLASGLRHKNRG